MKREALAKSLIFMPMAISFVGGSLIWNLMYQYQEPEMNQTGLVGQLMKSLGIPLPAPSLMVTMEQLVPHGCLHLGNHRLRHGDLVCSD